MDENKEKSCKGDIHCHNEQHNHCHKHEEYCAHVHKHECECDCEHEHEHGHVDCCCGHSHEHAEKPNYILYVASITIFAISFLFNKFALIPQIAAVLICGYPIFKTGLKSLVKLKFDETTLILIAVIAAICMGEYTEAYFITLLFTVGELIEDYAVDKSQSKVEELITLTDDTAYNELGEKIDAERIKIGDVFLVKPGDKVCTDAQITHGSSDFDTANLTGESIPTTLEVGDTVLAGYINLSSSVICTATSDYSNSTAAKIENYVRHSSEKKANTEKFITKFAKIYTPVIIIAALLMAVVLLTFKITDFADAVKRALTFMIASCPCAIVISIPLAYFSAIGAASKRGVLIKGSKFINTLAKTDCIAFDKTGTLTQGTLTVEKIITNGNISENELLSFICALEKHSSHPMAIAVCEYYNGEIPSPDTVSEVFGKGITGNVNGKQIIVGNKKLLEDNQIENNLNVDAHMYVCADNTLLGAIVLTDKIRSDAQQTVNILDSMGIKDIYMLSGDNAAAVQKTCEQIGQIQGFSELLPTDKAQKITEIKQNHKSIVYVGDGVNDAPSLAAADFGISAASTNAVALESGDAALIHPRLTSIPKIIALARYTMRVIYSNIIFALVIKFAVIIAAAFGYAPIWLALFADVGVLIISVLHSVTILYKK